MRFKGRMELEHGLKQMDIAPLIDVIFLLLIFFMLTSSFVIQPGIKVNLPKAVTSEAIKAQNLEILVSQENVIYLSGQAVSMDELKLLFKQAAKSGQTVLIRADRNSSLGRVVEIWDMARDFGISQVNIAANQE